MIFIIVINFCYIINLFTNFCWTLIIYIKKLVNSNNKTGIFKENTRINL